MSANLASHLQVLLAPHLRGTFYISAGGTVRNMLGQARNTAKSMVGPFWLSETAHG